MKKNKLLKIVSYLSIPILVVIMVLSFLSNYVQNYENIYKNEKDYFATDNFVSRYMSILSDFSNCLIYRNEEYPICYDGETQISYIGEGYRNDEIEIENCYVLIQYKNKAITNVELTSETNTIEKILNFISQNQNSQKANILAGNIESDSDILANKGIKYFHDFETTYYTIEEQAYIQDDSETEIQVIEELETDDSEKIQDNAMIQQQYKRQYITTNIQDFNIYSSYTEELKQNSRQVLMEKILENYKNLGKNVYIILPVCLALLLLIAIYLIISIGHSKGKDEIDLNDLDRIPLEIIAFVAVLFLGISIVILDSIGNFEQNIDLFISLLVTTYVVVYVVCAVLFDTTVKRIKAKTLIKNTLTYKCWRWFVCLFKKIMNQFKNIWCQSTISKSIVKKLLFVLIGYCMVAVILIGIFQGFGVILDLGLAIFIFYKIVERINYFTKIEKHLKEIYEGNHPAKLQSTDFTSEFQNMVTYINDISNGFENAIEEGIKSERLKTELITNVSHDIKTPLTSIINYVDLLKKEEIENEKVKEYIEVLENKSQRLKKLTEDLIEASKASSGNVKLKIETINIGELIKQSIGEFEDKFKAKSLELINNIPSEAIYINADNRYMYRIIENIFSNVAKYSMDNSRVYIDVMQKEKKVYITVKNISKDILNISEEELMQRFVRGDKSRTTEGSGLGISISKSLAEIQKGTMSIKVDGDLFKVELIFNIL